MPALNEVRATSQQWGIVGEEIMSEPVKQIPVEYRLR